MNLKLHALFPFRFNHVFMYEFLQDNILQGIKRKVEGSLVKETSQKGKTTLVYSSSIEDHVNDSHESEKESN